MLSELEHRNEKLKVSRGDSSATHGSKVMKIAHPQLHIDTGTLWNILPDKFVSMYRQMEGQTFRHQWQFQYKPLHFVVAGIKMNKKKKKKDIRNS